ncbi:MULTISPECIES: SDR family oxidoreductase [unclassified Pseudonocardia]|uniref:SDR family oxidoreductase n=1 Tax=unclassified Pseudonocardia TaxID=2619320 RepID=UPI00095D00EE|nr:MULTISPECIES: SDR family oxidoreductase [unclassified Pseudonocardia]MBN9098494.1 SDR family oxidoreductase [Pseudonocardia sp.]OJY40586.1 MAG: 3-ketoacyl-ACP reductase [Pseudonocardia sp. 73-21]
MRTALVTGVSRRRGIGFAIARRLLDDGHRVFAHSWSPYDATEPWGADPDGIDGVLAELGSRVGHLAADFEDASAPARLVAAAVERFGALDTLVVNHARSQSTGIGDLTADMLDRTWAVNVRATLLLVQAFAAQFTGETGRVVLFTSGQHRGPMPDEIPYIATKGALHQLTASLADALVDRGITVNCVNPGPTDTGWASADQDAFVGRHMPRGRWNSPAEAAAVVAMLLGPDAETITGQVVDAEGGFRRWTP